MLLNAVVNGYCTSQVPKNSLEHENAAVELVNNQSSGTGRHYFKKKLKIHGQNTNPNKQDE